MTNIDDVKAGKYELTAVRWDQITSKPGQPFDFVRHRSGDVLDLDVEDARRLVKAGAVKKPGEKDPAPETDPKPQPSVPPGGDGESDPTYGPVDTDPGDYTIAEVLAFVGEDATVAATVRDAEAARGEKGRSTLIEKLDAVAAAEPDGGEQ